MTKNNYFFPCSSHTYSLIQGGREKSSVYPIINHLHSTFPHPVLNRSLRYLPHLAPQVSSFSSLFSIPKYKHIHYQNTCSLLQRNQTSLAKFTSSSIVYFKQTYLLHTHITCASTFSIHSASFDKTHSPNRYCFHCSKFELIEPKHSTFRTIQELLTL
ncbi:hypothetical protein EYC80_006268 [Monilinia laxa]|uniref:Uncharacterized protein n=1 Tax=Monilinia laxa TaxID=61186 RepID=A0A5N6KGP3_MONLA|nr:hypothetical protein EYC80_006268 [Monilinia laxa]